MYRVWTKDCNGSVTILNDWTTKNKCLKSIIGRWGHFPPFAFISSAKTVEKFRQIYGN